MLQILTVGGLGLDNEPLICGGGFRKECYAYINEEWVVSSVLNEERESAAMSRTPSKELIITGGEVMFSGKKGVIMKQVLLT